jgi:diketogulonate reductase-like aldo/keto reductase
MSAAKIPVISSNGAHIPAIGLGTFRLRGADCARAVESALSVGYRHLDTAVMYDNETEVGQGLKNSGLSRDDVFVTTKVLPDNIGPGDLQTSARGSLKRLALEQTDLLLIHWPNKSIPLEGSIGALCDVKKQGMTRHVGVANFPTALLASAVEIAARHGEKLVANQCEYHPGLDQTKLLAACRSHGIAFVSYCPVGQGSTLANPAIAAIATRLGKTPGQIVMRWHMQQPGVAAIPKSGQVKHQSENIDVFDFELSDADMKALSSLASPSGRLVKPPFAPVWD